MRLAINGFGRIGRCRLRALYESPLRGSLSVVAINEPADLESMAYLVRFDSTHGRFPGSVAVQGEQLLINGDAIAVSHATRPVDVHRAALGVDLVMECSGQYASRGELGRFLDAGCPRVMVSHPANSAADVDATVVMGVNQAALRGPERLVSSASCTTNAIVPVLAALDRHFGIELASMTTLHSVMNDQPLIDGYHHADLRRTRSAMQSMVPVSTGLVRGVERLLPELAGRLQAKAIRVPVANVSAIDLAVTLARDATAAEINLRLEEAARDELVGLLDCSASPHASVDFNHNPHSAIVDSGLTRVAGTRLADLLVWFDNEWGFANRMLEVAACWQRRLGH